MEGENADSHNPHEPETEAEGHRLKALAEQKYIAGNLRSALKYAKRAHRLHPSLHGVPEMLTAFKILRTATKTPLAVLDDDAVLATATPTAVPPDYYKILQVERFAHINTIKKQYKKLALTLHPDKNPFVASEEAFKHVGEAFRVLSDKIRRKEYDMRVRIAMQSEAEAATGVGLGIGEAETFWTACSTCWLLHKFERKYLGHNLVCPSCKKSFKAVEVDEEKAEQNEMVEEGEKVNRRVSERIRTRAMRDGKMGSVGEVLKRSVEKEKELGTVGGNDSSRVKKMEKVLGNKSERAGLGNGGGGGGVIEGLRSRAGRKVERSSGVEVTDRTSAKRAKVGEEETMTLAQMQMLAKRKVSEEKMKLIGKEKGKGNGKDNEKEKENKETARAREKEKEREKDQEMEKEKQREMGLVKVKESEKRETASRRNRELEVEKQNKSRQQDLDIVAVEDDSVEIVGKRTSRRNRTLEVEKQKEPRQQDLDIMAVEDDSVEIVGKRTSRRNRGLEVEKQKNSRQQDLDIGAVEGTDFYDFGKDRLERSFKKGQVWATYDRDDKMPRHYALVDEVVSVNPFEVRLSWLKFQSNGVEQLISWEKMGFRISCGKFKVSGKATVKILKAFSHIADSERTARELYWIYPKKGSVWALYNENVQGSERRDEVCFDIVVLLTSYSEIHGMSIVYLEKVDAFKTIFKRRDFGAHAIRWLEKDGLKLFSHQIPARKLSGKEASGLSRDCWELDPSSLPPKLLTIG